MTSIVRQITMAFAEHVTRTGTTPTVVELGRQQADAFDRWLRTHVDPLGGVRADRLSRDRVLGMRVVRVGADDWLAVQ